MLFTTLYRLCQNHLTHSYNFLIIEDTCAQYVSRPIPFAPKKCTGYLSIVWSTRIGTDFHRYRIYIHVNQAVPSGQHASLLVAVGQEQVFARESPVEECAVQVLVHYAQESRFSFAQLRRFGRGDQSVFRIVIDEYFERIADLVGQRNITVGQQYFVLFVVDQIESVVRDAVLVSFIGGNGLTLAIRN